MRKICIEKYKEYSEPVFLDVLTLGHYYDIETQIGVQKMMIPKNLKVGGVYNLIFNEEEMDAYSYIVLKKEDSCVYYLAEYSEEYCDKFRTYSEKSLGESWVKCDVRKELGIFLKHWIAKKSDECDVIVKKTLSLKENVNYLKSCLYVADEYNLDEIISTADEISKTAYFLKSYKELDAQREKDVKETVMAYLDRNNTYDSALLKCIEGCFEER